MKIKLWGVFTTQNQLLFTDKEACIYADYKTAVKERGNHCVKSIVVESSASKTGGRK